MKKLLLYITFYFTTLTTFAAHITGGEVNYKYLGDGIIPNSKRYQVTLKIFRDNLCTGCAAMPTSVTIGVFNNDTEVAEFPNMTLGLSRTLPLSIISIPTCLDNPPLINYSVGEYVTEIELANNNLGYSVTYQTCCRIDNIANSGNGVGSTFVGTIPGLSTLFSINDNSAVFQTGISIICHNQQFNLDFSATDADGDQLVYSLVNAYSGGLASNSSFATPAPPPYGSVPYNAGYSGAQCLGSLAIINPATGIISGTAPPSGKYIVCVAVKSYRNGIYISETRKDFIVTVAPCNSVTAELNPSYTFCNFDANNAMTYSFANQANSPLNLTYNWTFGDPATGANNSSNLEFPNHTYSAPGDYTLTLVVNQGTTCERTATSIVHVYPGFYPTFLPIDTTCKNTPINFVSGGTLNNGVFNYWKWDFGVTSLSNDTSRLQSTTYTYATAGNYNVSLIVKSSKGCVDTLERPIVITDSAYLVIPKDTLICEIDTLQFNTNVNTGTIIWSPNYMISNVNSFNPLVSPDVTTTYTASYISPSGCTATKSVTVKVVNEVTLLALNDTTICRTDTTQLNLNTDALYYSWTPTNLIVNPTVKNPRVFPTAQFTTFHVKASISNKCFKEKDIVVKTVPYPVVNITGDNIICNGNNASMNATGGSTYLWTPSTFLNNVNIANPAIIKPAYSITYKVQVTDTFGCPKPVFKTFSVEVVKIIANAGPADTSIVLEQPLQLNGTSSVTNNVTYLWSPNTWLTATNISNPTANPTDNIKYYFTVTNSIGCKGIDSINVKVYTLPPDIYIPSAFSPDGDGKNDVIRPIALGIKKLENFSVYNRLGELLFTTSSINKGWDGTYKGQKQDPTTYVWQATAIDYKGKTIFRKGTVILIR
jgi:gliding motility-associated-like protein